LRSADDMCQLVVDDPREGFEHVNGAKISKNQSLTPDLRLQEPGKVWRYFLSSVFAQLPPENRSLYDFDVLEYFQIEQVFVSADNIVGSTLYSALKELIVAWIATDMNLFLNLYPPAPCLQGKQRMFKNGIGDLKPTHDIRLRKHSSDFG